MTGQPIPPRKEVSSYCYQCVAGPDLLKIEIEKGVPVQVRPNFSAAEIHPAGGKVCVKAFGLIQKTNNPYRILSPMIRTNPKKGRDEDPGFRPISWDEALDLVARKLGDIKTEFGPDSIGLLTSARITDEENYVAQKFARAALKTNNVDHCARL